jgi:hypothetical protein
MLSEEGVYPETIPEETVVPDWAYLRPCDFDGCFDPRIAWMGDREFSL